MKAFRFPLDRVLHWRKLQAELEEAATRRIAAQQAQIAKHLEEITSLRKRTADSLLAESPIRLENFQTLASFNTWADQQKLRVQAHARQLQQEAEAQLLRTAEARRKTKLLEKLRASRVTKWTALRNAEDEQAAADSWLSRFAAERYTTHNDLPPSR